MTANITDWANSAVELKSTAWITVVRWSHQPFTGIGRQCTRLCATIIQKTTAVVFENIWTSFATDGSRHADQLSLLWIKWIRNCTNTRVQQILFFVRIVCKWIFYKPKICNVNVNLCCKSEKNISKWSNVMLYSYFSFSWISCEKIKRETQDYSIVQKVRPAHIFAFIFETP